MNETYILVLALYFVSNLQSASSSRNNYEQNTYVDGDRGNAGNGHLAKHTWFFGLRKSDTSLGDGLNVQWIHNVNGKTDLEKELKNDDDNDDSAPYTRVVIGGDVYLQKSPNRIPIMAVQPNKANSLTLKQWLKMFMSIQNDRQKFIQLNFHSTDVVEPALQYLSAVRYELKVPVILHANIESERYSFREPVDPYIFINSISEELPNSIISVGWTPLTGLNDELAYEITTRQNKKFTWRMIFDMLENVYNARQPVIFRCRAHLASYSLHQLLWLSKIKPSFHLTLWSFDKDMIDNWTGLAALRKYVPKEKIFYDLSPGHSKEFFEYYDFLQKGIYLEERPWNRHNWEIIQFVNPTAILSTIVLSDEGVGFFGWPTSMLLSKTKAKPGFTQSVRGKVLFVPKENYLDVNPMEKSGFSIYLLDSIEDMPSSNIRSGIRALISSDGQISIENRMIYRRYDSTSRQFVDVNRHILPRKSSSQLQLYDCYGFTLIDSLTNIQLTVYPTKCSGSDTIMPNNTYLRTITLDVPAPASSGSRYVLVQKTGDSNIDCLVEDLFHKNRAAPGAQNLYNANNFASVVFQWQIYIVVIVLQRVIISLSM